MATAASHSTAKPLGPPSGGNGGRGSNLHILPTLVFTTLSSVPRRVHGLPGGSGHGTWQHGKNMEPTVVKGFCGYCREGTGVRRFAAGFK